MLVLEESDRPIEITTIQYSKLEEVLSSIQSGIDLVSATNYELLLCHRVYSGIGLTHESLFNDLKKKFNVDIFRERLAELCFLNVERSLKVCNGFLLTGDRRSAALSANNAVKHSFNMLLAMKGATSILEKWQMRYATQYLGEEHLAFRNYLELISNVPHDSPMQMDFYVEKVKNFHQLICDYRIIKSKMTDADFFKKTRISQSHSPRVPMVVSKAKLARVICRGSVFYLIVDATPVLELPEKAALLWALIDTDTTVDQLVSEAKARIGLAPDTILEFLKAFGAVQSLNILNFDFAAVPEITSDLIRKA
ncbi:hypothetical protein [Pseudomonas syringae]|uniref:hypothetical protein n=1 Tax=Pseudomonas syringae TaxID=317 RepID=UPI003F753B61